MPYSLIRKKLCKLRFDPKMTETYNSSYNRTPPISRVLIGQHMIFCSLTSPTCCNVTRLENLRQLNITTAQKLGFQLSHRQPLKGDIIY